MRTSGRRVRASGGAAHSGTLLAVAASPSYAFQPQKFFNLEASPFIKAHSDITGKEVAQAIRRAIV